VWEEGRSRACRLAAAIAEREEEEEGKEVGRQCRGCFFGRAPLSEGGEGKRGKEETGP